MTCDVWAKNFPSAASPEATVLCEKLVRLNASDSDINRMFSFVHHWTNMGRFVADPLSDAIWLDKTGRRMLRLDAGQQRFPWKMLFKLARDKKSVHDRLMLAMNRKVPDCIPFEAWNGDFYQLTLHFLASDLRTFIIGWLQDITLSARALVSGLRPDSQIPSANVSASSSIDRNSPNMQPVVTSDNPVPMVVQKRQRRTFDSSSVPFEASGSHVAHTDRQSYYQFGRKSISHYSRPAAVESDTLHDVRRGPRGSPTRASVPQSIRYQRTGHFRAQNIMQRPSNRMLTSPIDPKSFQATPLPVNAPTQTLLQSAASGGNPTIASRQNSIAKMRMLGRIPRDSRINQRSWDMKAKNYEISAKNYGDVKKVFHPDVATRDAYSQRVLRGRGRFSAWGRRNHQGRGRILQIPRQRVVADSLMETEESMKPWLGPQGVKRRHQEGWVSSISSLSSKRGRSDSAILSSASHLESEDKEV
eukprot:CAMPEP_0167765860 /NCGR_PEP_ID=MMETSP0110_2-20121227/14963_1 /TAXON_ID=629695 /ORGANISM="Gymnochlora sp., Strain CCMP2014" /LENGTH=472 /DNA_ID=CAMNT_0007653703 /DNA_START=304 /DNA_END=1722 /DNA_ORIENTATION=+